MKNAPKFRIRVFDTFGKEEFEKIYDELYEEKYNMLVEENGLVCCNTIASIHSIKDVWEGLLHIYEGMCYSVEAIYEEKVEHVIGGTYDPNDYEYIEEYIENLNTPKTYKVRFTYLTNVEVEVEAKSEEKALELAGDKLDAMDDELFERMIVDHLGLTDKTTR